MEGEHCKAGTDHVFQTCPKIGKSILLSCEMFQVEISKKISQRGSYPILQCGKKPCQQNPTALKKEFCLLLLICVFIITTMWLLGGIIRVLEHLRSYRLLYFVVI